MGLPDCWHFICAQESRQPNLVERLLAFHQFDSFAAESEPTFRRDLLVKDAQFFLYLANDSLRIPVLVEAVLPVASARVELTKAK